MCECEIVHLPTNHAVDGAKEHGALGGRGTLAQVLQHKRAVAEDVDKLTKVEDPHLLQVLPLLVCSGRTDVRQDRIQREEREYRGMEHVRRGGVEPGAIKSKSTHTEKKMSKAE